MTSFWSLYAASSQPLREDGKKLLCHVPRLLGSGMFIFSQPARSTTGPVLYPASKAVWFNPMYVRVLKLGPEKLSSPATAISSSSNTSKSSNRRCTEIHQRRYNIFSEKHNEIRPLRLACTCGQYTTCVNMNDGVTQQKGEEGNPGPVVAAGDAGAVAI